MLCTVLGCKNQLCGVGAHGCAHALPWESRTPLKGRGLHRLALVRCGGGLEGTARVRGGQRGHGTSRRLGGDAVRGHDAAHWMVVRYVQSFCCPSCEWITPHQIHSTPSWKQQPWKNKSEHRPSRLSTPRAGAAQTAHRAHRPSRRWEGGEGGEGTRECCQPSCLWQLPRAGWPAGVLLRAWRVAATRNSCSPQPGCCRDWAAGCWLRRCLLARSASLVIWAQQSVVLVLVVVVVVFFFFAECLLVVVGLVAVLALCRGTQRAAAP